MRLFLCLKGSDKFEQEVFEALYGNQSRRDSTDLYLFGGQSGYSVEYCDAVSYTHLDVYKRQGYIVPEYEVLHTQSREYIVDDLLDVMKERGVEV